MLTCWQLSTNSPVAGSGNELARPPSLGRLSRIVIRSPRSTRHDATARPASPPPTITIWGGGACGRWPSSLYVVRSVLQGGLSGTPILDLQSWDFLEMPAVRREECCVVNPGNRRDL